IKPSQPTAKLSHVSLWRALPARFASWRHSSAFRRQFSTLSISKHLDRAVCKDQAFRPTREDHLGVRRGHRLVLCASQATVAVYSGMIEPTQLREYSFRN